MQQIPLGANFPNSANFDSFSPLPAVVQSNFVIWTAADQLMLPMFFAPLPNYLNFANEEVLGCENRSCTAQILPNENAATLCYFAAQRNFFPPDWPS